MYKRLVGAALIVFGLGMVTPVARAQVPTYPPVPISVCIRLVAGLHNGHPVLVFRERVLLFGGPGCGLVGETVTVVFHSTPVVIGSTKVAEDGSFRIDATLPDEVTPGDHQLVVDKGSEEIVRPVEVVSALGEPASSQTSQKSAHNIALLSLWTLMLIGAAAAVVFYGRRRFAVVGGRRRSGRVAPGTTLPHVDTARFTPMRRLRDKTPSEPPNPT